MYEELLAKAKEAKDEKELYEMVKKEGIELTEESVKSLFKRLHSEGELSDDDLDSVSGGGCGGSSSGGGSTKKEDDSGYSLDTGDEAYILWGEPCPCTSKYVEVLYCNGGYDTASKRYLTKCTECGRELVYWAYELKKML